MARWRRLTVSQTAGVACIALAIGGVLAIAASGRTDDPPVPARGEPLPRREDLPAQRRYAWDVVAKLDLIDGTRRALSAKWLRAEDMFMSAALARAANGKTDAHGTMAQSGEPQIIIFTLYDAAAAGHIRAHKLHERAQLEHLLATGLADPRIPENRTIPPFPAETTVLLTAWWPIASEGTTAMPVWDPELNPTRSGGNNYATWHRAVAVSRSNTAGTEEVVTSGRHFPTARRVSLDAFHSIVVDDEIAARNRQNDHAHKAAVIALGRELRAGDALALVAVHVAVKVSEQWAWATLWWHDAADRGAFAQDRPAALPGAWRNYLLDVAFDAELPRAADGGPHAAFNPWLEARFPDAGAGGGVVSNCVACHGRASYPAVSFLPVTRGAPNLSDDPAYAPGRLRTDFLWSLPRQAR